MKSTESEMSNVVHMAGRVRGQVKPVDRGAWQRPYQASTRSCRKRAVCSGVRIRHPVPFTTPHFLKGRSFLGSQESQMAGAPSLPSATSNA